MRTILIIVLLFGFGNVVISQSRMENICLERIINTSKTVEFPSPIQPVKISNDTIEFKRSMVILSNSCQEAFQIFQKGILYPNLVAGASTNGDGKLYLLFVDIIENLRIDSFQPLTEANSSSCVRTFSFLILRKDVINPFLYILQLKNENANENTESKDFIDGSHISAFGFCSILL